MSKVQQLYSRRKRQALPPLIGALTRRPAQAARQAAVEALHASGFDDISAAHLAVFQHPGPEGRTPGELAARAQTTKQAMNHLLGQLESADYLHRCADPHNGRQRRVELTPRGIAALEVIRAGITALEQQWRAALGDDRYTELVRSLTALNRLID